jgi:hypothetical protein
VNGEVAEALRSAPEFVPAVWMRLRNRWEYGHVAGFVMLFVIMPTNKGLLSSSLDKRSEETRKLLDRWNRLHAVRSALSVVALVLFLTDG